MEADKYLLNEYVASIGVKNYAYEKEIAIQKKQIEDLRNQTYRLRDDRDAIVRSKDERIRNLESKYKELNDDLCNRIKGLAPMAEHISTCEYTDGTVETIVAWDDGTATKVRLAKDEWNDPYNAFCAAMAKKLYGTNSAIKRIVHAKNNAHLTNVER